MQQNHISSFFKQYTDDINYMSKHPNELIGLSTGIDELDKCFSGFRKGDLIVLASHPSMGRTEFALSVSRTISRHFQRKKSGEVVLYFNLAESGLSLAQRLISILTTFPIWTVRKPSDDIIIQDEINAAITLLSELPLYFNNSVSNIDDVQSAIEDVRQDKKIRFIVIDYLQCFGWGQINDYSDILNQLKDIAKKLDIPILVLSPVNGLSAIRECKRPLLCDLYRFESKLPSIDIVLFLYREHYYLQFDEPKRKRNESSSKFKHRLKEWQEKCEEMKSVCEVLVRKNKHGRIAEIKTHFTPGTWGISNYD